MTYLAENLKHLRKLYKLSQEDFAGELSIKKPRLAAYETLRAEPPLSLLNSICEYFKLSMDIVVNSDLKNVSLDEIKKLGKDRVLFPIKVQDDKHTTIEIITPLQAKEYLDNYSNPEFIKNLKIITLPFKSRSKLRAFPVYGKAMLPITEGSYIIGKYIRSPKRIKDNYTYTLLTRDKGLIYHRTNNLQRKEQIECISDNKIFPPFSIAYQDIIEIWQYKYHVDTKRDNPDGFEPTYIVNLLEKLQSEIAELKNQLNQK